jgi:hypothetical protein
VLQLRHVLLGRRVLRERPRQHEFGFEDRLLRGNQPIKRGAHPVDSRVLDEALDVIHRVPGLTCEPAPVQRFRDLPELHHEIAGQVLGFRLAPLLPPEPNKGRSVSAHDDPRIGAAKIRAAILGAARLVPRLGIRTRDRDVIHQSRLLPAGSACVTGFYVYQDLHGGQLVSIKKSRGRPPTGPGRQLMIRCHDDFLASIDEYRRKQPDLPSRAEAIRRLVRLALELEAGVSTTKRLRGK